MLTYCGGEDCFPVVREAFYRYDPVTDRWSPLPLPKAYHGMGAGGVIGGKFYVAAGVTTQLEVYDPKTNVWTTKAPLGSQRTFPAGAVAGGKLCVLGGFREDSTGAATAPTTSVYDPVVNSWTHAARLPSPMQQFAAARLTVNGRERVEVVGGVPPGNNLQLVR